VRKNGWCATQNSSKDRIRPEEESTEALRSEGSMLDHMFAGESVGGWHKLLVVLATVTSAKRCFNLPFCYTLLAQCQSLLSVISAKLNTSRFKSLQASRVGPDWTSLGHHPSQREKSNPEDFKFVVDSEIRHLLEYVLKLALFENSATRTNTNKIFEDSTTRNLRKLYSG
jgi:hypothetical protein